MQGFQGEFKPMWQCESSLYILEEGGGKLDRRVCHFAPLPRSQLKNARSWIDISPGWPLHGLVGRGGKRLEKQVTLVLKTKLSWILLSLEFSQNGEALQKKMVWSWLT